MTLVERKILDALQGYITSPVLVQSICVHQHTQDVPAKQVLPSNLKFITCAFKMLGFRESQHLWIEIPKAAAVTATFSTSTSDALQSFTADKTRFTFSILLSDIVKISRIDSSLGIFLDVTRIRKEKKAFVYFILRPISKS